MTTIEPRTAVVTIYTGDYLDRIRDLERRAEAAEDAAAPKRVGEKPEYMRLADEHDALVEEAEESALHVKVQALGRRVWKALVAAHPPREGNDADKTVGVNEDTFKDALVAGGKVTIGGQEVEYRTIVEPALTEDDLDNLADIDYDRLYYTAFGLNRGAPAAPKAGLASRMIQQNSETSD